MKTINSIWYRGLFGIAMAMCLVACSSNNDDLSRYIYETKKKPSRPIEPIPSFPSQDKFIYPENETRRNPFKPITHKEKSTDDSAPDQNRTKMPLEQFPLDALKFVGTLQDGRTRWGLVSQPDGRIVRVKTGDYMGQDYGKILKINPNSLLLQETLKIGGQWKKKETTFKLKTND